jgi:alpha-glucosidase
VVEVGRRLPDLNWENPAVVRVMHDTLRFWLERGVDGFRMDVIHCIGKDPRLPDLPEDLAKIPACALNDHDHTHALLRGIRGVLEEYPGAAAALSAGFFRVRAARRAPCVDAL